MNLRGINGSAAATEKAGMATAPYGAREAVRGAVGTRADAAREAIGVRAKAGRKGTEKKAKVVMRAERGATDTGVAERKATMMKVNAEPRAEGKVTGTEAADAMKVETGGIEMRVGTNAIEMKMSGPNQMNIRREIIDQRIAAQRRDPVEICPVTGFQLQEDLIRAWLSWSHPARDVLGT